VSATIPLAAFERVHFDCTAGTALNPTDVSCAITSAADPLGLPIDQTQFPACEVALAASGTSGGTTTTTAPAPSTTSTTVAPTTSTTSLPPTTSTTETTTTLAGATTTTTSTLPAPVCGDGIIEEGETCDDGNTVDGDSCPSNCRIDSCTPVTRTLAG